MNVVQPADGGQGPSWLAAAVAIAVALLVLGSFRSWRNPNDFSEPARVLPPVGAVGQIVEAGAPDSPLCTGSIIRPGGGEAPVVLSPLHPFAQPGEAHLLQTYDHLVKETPRLLFRSPGASLTLTLERAASRRPPPALPVSSALMDDLAAFILPQPPAAALSLAQEDLEVDDWVDVVAPGEEGGAAPLLVRRARVYSISSKEAVLVLRGAEEAPWLAPGAPALDRKGEMAALVVAAAGDGVTLLAIPSREIRMRLTAKEPR